MQLEQGEGGTAVYKYRISALDVESRRARETLFRFSEDAYVIATQQVRLPLLGGA